MCTKKKKKKAKTDNDSLMMLWFLYVIQNHCVPCYDVETYRAVTIASQSHQRECLCATEDLYVCHSKVCCKKTINSFFWGGNGQKQHITLCYLTPIKTTAVSIHSVVKSFIYNITRQKCLSNIAQNDTWWEIKEIKACAVYSPTGST